MGFYPMLIPEVVILKSAPGRQLWIGYEIDNQVEKI